MKDAIGQQIKEGWAAVVEPSRGSIRAKRVYIIGTSGHNRVRFIGCVWGEGTTASGYNEYKDNPEAFPIHKTTLKINTRIIMLGEQNEDL